MPAVWTEQQIITNLLRGGSFWSGSTITFGFPTTTPTWATGTESSGFSAFSATQRTAGTLAISMWDDLIAPNMVLTTNAPQITMQNGYAGSAGYYAYSYFPGSQAIGAGSVWMNNYYNSSQGTNDLVTPTIGKWGFLTYLHELGHAMGLSHPGNYNGGSPTYAIDAAYTHDSIEYSVMSYFDASNTGADWQAANGSFYYPQTLMIDDVAAIQQRYGADLTTRSGNTVYGFNSTLSGVSGGIFDFTQNTHPIMTIWDGAGIDTLDLSGFTTVSRIDLHSGVSSDCDGMTNNIWIAYNCNIENASGGSAADNITGNDLINVLIGNGGNDVISAAAGDDQIIGGTGSDTLTGGLGNDMFIFNAADLTAGQADTITDFVHDAVGVGDTVRLVGITASTVSVAMSGANAVVSYGNGTIVDTITALAAGTNAFYVNGYSSLANAQANILANGFVFVSDAMNQIAHTWSSYLQTFDGSSILDTQNTINDNGTRVFVDYDNAGNQAWTTTTDSYDSLNRLVTRNTLNDNSSHSLITYDTSNQIWANITDNYDTLNRLTTKNTLNDDGSHILITYYTPGQNVITSNDVFDSANRQLTRSVSYNDGTSTLQNFDAIGNQNYSSYTSSFDAANALTYRITNYRDGTSYTTHFDTTSQPWSSYNESYDAQNRLDYRVTTYDDSSTYVTHLDRLANQNWSTYVESFDAQGRMDYRVTTYDDNSLYVTHLDRLANQPWSSYVETFDAQGRLDTRITTNDNNSLFVTHVDHNNNLSWSTYIDIYDTQGRNTFESFNFDDGTKTDVTFDISNQAWARDIFNYDSSGLVTLHYRVMDDGSTIVL